ncbi:cysteine desulfurase NifS [Gallibacter intestinalis]|uniref:Cysteine desulfurase IscS n=1 Tax=Gallibacter intestinalis TaxID=2779356 RepID=A0ABR9QW51_9FIRM|nr:cysteine desulfurase NifS [Gallibacter intestinalis]MBE5034977.1 cysteine desulfurase NifS [Gallibacter intestinalis]
MKNVYMDYSATTPVKKEVLDAMLPYFSEHFGNPSSLYSIAQESKEALEKARGQVASLIGAKANEVFFTAGGSEADNWALEGVADALKDKGNHIITTKIEHHAILHTAEYLEKHGIDVTYLDVDAEGRVNPVDVEKAITDKTVLISIMMVNNEVGTIEPIKEIAEIAHNHGILLHTDAVQALGNVPIDVDNMGIDLMSMSGHKIYGPKGVGALYIRKGTKISNFIHGGAQEMKKRAGTENLAGIVGFGKAAELAKENLESHINRVSELRDYFISEVTSKIPDTIVNGSMEHRHPGNANISFEYIEGESMLILLDMNGISVSTGSACSSKSLTPSHVLSAMGIPVERIHGTLRFTIGDPTTKEDIDYVIEKLVEIVQKLRELSPVSREKGWE